VRRGEIISAGGYRTDLRNAEDFDLWLRILEHGTAVVSPAIVSIYHRCSGQTSRDAEARHLALSIASQTSARWWSSDLLDRRIAVDAWDDFLTALRQKRLPAAAAQAGTLLRRPARLRAVAALVAWGQALKRRSSMVARDGGPTVGLLPGAPIERAGTRPVIDLRAAHWTRIVTVLLRRPPGTVACRSPRAAALARRLGSEPIWIAGDAAPRTAPLRMASFPTPDNPPAPYLELLHAALASHSVDLVPVARFNRSLARSGSGRPDVVHLHWIEYLVRSGGTGASADIRAAVATARLTAALWALQRTGTAIVWTVHNLRPHESGHSRLEEAAMRATARFANKIIVHSEHARRQVERTYGHRSKLQIVPHGNFAGYYPPPRRSRHELRTSLGLSDDTFTFLVFGQVRRYKRIPETVAAFRRLRGTDVALIVAGSPSDPIERAAVEEAVDDDPRIRLRLDFVPDEEVTELHLAADAAVLGYREVFSSGALLLALSLGLPAVVPDRGSALEVAGPPAVELFKSGRLGDALNAVRAGDHARRRAAAQAAGDAADWDAIGRRTAAIYREAVAEARGRGPERASRP
jgi:glycosyltransferase involved in cell wall biosynthesis